MLETASILLVRRPHAPEILWMQRTETARFLSGFHVFPGGHVEAQDRAQALELGLGSHGAARIAALREAFEEVGADWRGSTPAHAGQIPFEADPGIAAALRDVGVWQTPPFTPRPYRTRFFLAVVPEGLALSINPREVAELAWVRPQAALDAWARGEALLVPPTRWALESLARAEAQGVGLGDGLEAIFLADPRAHDVQPQRARLHPTLEIFPQRSPTWAPATHTNCVTLGAYRPVVVDPGGEAEALGPLLEALDAQGGAEAIVLTHHHPDHALSAPALAARYGAPIYAHPLTIARLGEPARPIEAGPLRFEAARLTAYHTPGHAEGHLCLLHHDSGFLIAGDLISGLGSIFVDEMADYLDSLNRMIDVEARALIPSHGAPIGGVAYHLQRQRDHRLKREGLILDALGDAPDFEALLGRVYKGVAAAFTAGPGGGLAGRTLAAHLRKLGDEGRLSLGEDKRYRLI
ncbi:MBL fold metallo-hydrolase [Myxococcota bacterium]|nr:MBL fold metallo-hydrolase [Myxococcota bacterium]MBU1431043.1 MBL fold metallo-hydrolase [Myxococcota bacterium]MBU1898630.1 MBL fold metallo-hydrolase [Myxococcota bacterium]